MKNLLGNYVAWRDNTKKICEANYLQGKTTLEEFEEEYTWQGRQNWTNLWTELSGRRDNTEQITVCDKGDNTGRIFGAKVCGRGTILE